MGALANCQLIERWQIVDADIWDCDHFDFDLCGLAAGSSRSLLDL
jgi:hypothetical protein